MAHDTLRQQLACSALPRLEAQMLWAYVLGVGRSWLIAHDTDPLGNDAVQAYQALQARRLAGEPMAYILGVREFFGRDFHVTPDVLIPRPETELLVEVALNALQGRQAPAVMDLGTGSGAIAISIALERPDARVAASDFSAAALRVAQMNARRMGASLQFFCGNWYDSLLGLPKLDLIVSNPPYIHADDPHLHQGDLRHEPVCALTDGADGLSDLATIIGGAVQHLAPGGLVCIEHGWDQADAVRELLQGHSFIDIASHRDLAGIQRVACGRLSF